MKPTDKICGNCGVTFTTVCAKDKLCFYCYSVSSARRPPPADGRIIKKKKLPE
jgi:protein-arginine kinase activator protein McsA